MNRTGPVVVGILVPIVAMVGGLALTGDLPSWIGLVALTGEALLGVALLALALVADGAPARRLAALDAAAEREGRRVCPKCGRPMLQGQTVCSYCKQGGGRPAPELEMTIDESYRPLDAPLALPGLDVAKQRVSEGGQKGCLYVIEGHEKGLIVALPPEGVNFGRDNDCSVVVDDKGVSGRHAEIRFEKGRCILRDLGSKNGTFVNDRRVDEAVLCTCDVVGVGGTKIMVTLN